MKKGTVRRRIFVSDTAMVLTTLFLFLLVNLLVLKIYSEAIEKAFLDSAEQIVNAQELEELLKQRILYQNKFLLLTAADGIACVLILIGVSRFFTRHRARRRNYMAERTGRQYIDGSWPVFDRPWHQTFPDRNDCYFRHVPSGNFRFHTAPDFRSVHAGNFRSERLFKTELFLFSSACLFRIRCSCGSRNGSKGKPPLRDQHSGSASGHKK